MDRRSFLTGTVAATAAGLVTLATDSEVAAFVSPGDKASLLHDPFPLLYGGVGNLVFMQNDHQHYVPIGVVESIEVRNEPPLDITSYGDTFQKFMPSTRGPEARIIVLANGRARLF